MVKYVTSVIPQGVVAKWSGCDTLGGFTIQPSGFSANLSLRMKRGRKFSVCKSGVTVTGLLKVVVVGFA